MLRPNSLKVHNRLYAAPTESRYRRAHLGSPGSIGRSLAAPQTRELLSSSAEQVEQSPEFRRVVLDLLQTERVEMERLTEHDGVSPTVAGRAIRPL